MSRPSSCAPIHVALLRCAALLVPAAQRPEWLAEWRSELWYVARASSGKPIATAFCLGSFADAFWIRRNTPHSERGMLLRLESPWQCLSFLALLAAASLWGAFRLPGAREAILPPDRDASAVVLISHGSFPAMPLEEYRSLAGRARSRFSGIAYFRPVRAAMRTATGRTQELSIAVAGNNLLPVLGISALHPELSTDGGKAALLLMSRAAWRQYFDADPRIMGRTFDIAGRPVHVAGIVSLDAWELPGHVDAWLLQDERVTASMPAESNGFVIGRIIRSAPGVEATRGAQWRVFVPDGRGGSQTLGCASLARRPAFLAHFLMLFIAFLILPAVTSLELGEYPAGRRLSRAIRLRRWVFLGIKILLLIVIVFCGTVDLAAVSSTAFQPHGWLIGYVIAFRWALMDQRQRCPVCLRLLINPTRIGRLSATLLEWCGTELMCRKGHGLLHIPAIPASSYSSQRWLQLDPSWSGLFQQPEPVSRR